MIAIAVSLFLVVNILSVWLNIYNFDSIQFIRTSNQLSEEQIVAESEDAVVMIRAGESKGTGFAISADGLIMTNHHVIDSASDIRVFFPNGEMYLAEVLQSDEELDIATIKVEADNLPYLPLSERQAEEHEPIYVIGNPLSHNHIANQGEVLESTGQFQVLKISNPIYPGHSGSPVLSEEGEVIAVVYARTIPELFSGDSSSGLAVPIEQIRESFTFPD